MGLSAADIAGVIEEVAPAVVGGWIQKVYQPSPVQIEFFEKRYRRFQKLGNFIDQQ